MAFAKALQQEEVESESETEETEKDMEGEMDSEEEVWQAHNYNKAAFQFLSPSFFFRYPDFSAPIFRMFKQSRQLLNGSSTSNSMHYVTMEGCGCIYFH